MERQKEGIESYIFGSLGDGYRINGDFTDAVLFGIGTLAATRAMDILKRSRIVIRAVEASVEAVVAGLDIINNW